MQTIQNHSGTAGTGNGGSLPIHVHVDSGGVSFSNMLLPTAIVVAIIILIILTILVIREYNLRKNKKKNV